MSFELLEKIALTVIGAIIGWGLNSVERIIVSRGKVQIFYKRIYSSFSGKPWGIRKQMMGDLFEIPIKFEIQNNSSVTKFVRDVTLHLYNGRIEVDKFTNIEYCNFTVDKEKTKEIYADNGSYSFVIPFKSIVKYKCYFSLKKNDDNLEFDNIKLSYYDHNNKKHIYDICKIENGWDSDEFPIDKDWIKLE